MSALTAANQLTLLRMLLIPVLALLVLYDRMGWALVVLVLAALTDALDGLLARRTGPTTLGAWLDPVADKLLIATMFVVLTLPLPQLVQRVPL
jgi:cardiolipin synthase